jgi:membrane fusion protein (multidrug efflux system)
MLLNVAIQIGSRNGLAVPELAVIGEGTDRYVFIVGPGEKAVKTKVATGIRDGGLIEVRGLPPTARVIGEGVVKVADGTVVKLQAAGPGTNAGKAPEAS